jgi:hypothetical protein
MPTDYRPAHLDIEERDRTRDDAAQLNDWLTERITWWQDNTDIEKN